MPSGTRDDNRVPSLIAKSDADNTAVVLEADPTTKRLKVNATITGAASDGSIVDGVDTAIKATVLDYASSNPLAVRLTDTAGDYIAAGAGTQYTEDAVAATDPVGSMLMAVRRDTLSATEVSADGDNIALKATNKGALHVKHADTLTVDGSGVTQPVSGTFWQATQPVSGTVSITANSAVNVAQINGVTPLMGNGVTGTGSQRVTIASDNTAFAVNATLSAETTKVIGTVNVAAAQTIATTNAGTFAVQAASAGDVAHDAVDSGNPQKIGGQARTTNPTAVADADRTNAIFDKLGKQVVVGSIRDLKVNQITTITSSTAETTVLTAVASTFLDVYGVIVVNSSATAANVSFKDSTAGTTRFNVYVPAGDTRGFMLNESAAVAQTTVNNNWTATSSASVASLVITMLGVKNI